MRVTGNSFTNSFLPQLNTLNARQQRLQTQAATGQRIHAPEDDPAAVRRALGLQGESQRLHQFGVNIATLKARASVAFSSIRSLKQLSDRAGEIATLADGTKSPEELKTYATEITELIKQAAQVLNARHGQHYLFGGTKNDQPPFVLTQDANGNVTSVSYQGNASVPETEIEEGSTLAIDVPGRNISGSGARGLAVDSRTGADFFAHLISLQDHLLAGDTAAINTVDQPALARDEENLIYHIGNNGALQTRLETAVVAASARSQSLTAMLSEEADADLTHTIVQLNQAQYAYQAALQSGAGIMRNSLLEYLR